MTNFEYWKEELIKLLNGTCVGIAISKNDYKPRECYGMKCDDCLLNKRKGCTKNLIQWLYEEHVESPKLTKEERAFCEFIESGWIARDLDGGLFWYIYEPIKTNDGWSNMRHQFAFINSEMFPNIRFSFIQHEDENAWKTEDLLKLEVEE